MIRVLRGGPIVAALLAAALALPGCGEKCPTCSEPQTGPPPPAVVSPNPTPAPVSTPAPTPTPTPRPRPTATPPPGALAASVTFRSTSCQCVVGRIRNYVDGRHEGSMACNQQQTYAIGAGSHQLEARDDQGKWGPTTRDFANGERFTLNLNCH